MLIIPGILFQQLWYRQQTQTYLKAHQGDQCRSKCRGRIDYSFSFPAIVTKTKVFKKQLESFEEQDNTIDMELGANRLLEDWLRRVCIVQRFICYIFRFVGYRSWRCSTLVRNFMLPFLSRKALGNMRIFGKILSFIDNGISVPPLIVDTM